MKQIVRLCFLVWMVCSCLACDAQNKERARVEHWLEQSRLLPTDSCRVLYFARQMMGTPYQGGTLDRSRVEQLVTRVDSVDCTTFVEVVLAMALTNDNQFDRFCANIQRLRYRQGVLDGYTSRLHYFSDWIMDNERMGILSEQTCNLGGMETSKSINFMTNHPDSYLSVQGMAEIELRLSSTSCCYLPKDKVRATKGIANGDVIAITTSIEGLDISHVGFAIWVNGEVHLLHASSAQKKVVIDPLPLEDYLAKHASQTGIRVIRPYL